MRKKKAFTLAEVLITLTIIGVIAAITIPNLMQKQKKHEVEVRLKEVYSILSNTLAKATADTGYSIADIWDNTCNGYSSGSNLWARATFFTENYILPYVKYKDKCAYLNDTCSKGALKRIANNTTYGVLLENGMYVEIGIHNYGVIVIRVDIDGRTKGKNQDGYDQFIFNIKQNNKIIEAGNTDGYRPDLGCNASKGYSACVYPIMRNGWKIPDNYPLKKF